MCKRFPSIGMKWTFHSKTGKGKLGFLTYHSNPKIKEEKLTKQINAKYQQLSRSEKRQTRKAKLGATISQMQAINIFDTENSQ